MSNLHINFVKIINLQIIVTYPFKIVMSLKIFKYFKILLLYNGPYINKLLILEQKRRTLELNFNKHEN